METDEIYKYIGCALVFLFIIYIISRTIQTNTRIIEGMKSKKKSKKDDEEEEPDVNDDEDWMDGAKQKIKDVDKETKVNSGLYNRQKVLFNKLFDAKRKWLNTAFLNLLFSSIYQDTLDTNQGTLLKWKTQIDLIDYAIANKGGNSGGNSGGGDKGKKKDSSMF